LHRVGRLDEHEINKIYKVSSRGDVPLRLVMGLGNWRDRIDQLEEDESYSGTGLNI